MTEFQVRKTTKEDEPNINKLFSKVFQKQRSPELWRWLYHDTPGGTGLGVIALDGHKFIAHAGLVRRPLWLGNQEVSGGQSIDAMTAPEYQRKGLNRKLQVHLGKGLKAEGMKVVYGFSNEHSTPGILKHQGRVAMGPFPLLAKWISARNLVRGGGPLPAPRAAIIPDDYAPFEGPSETKVSAALTREYLRWRYQKPEGIYREVVLRKAGALEGLGILSIRKQGGVRAAFICEILAPQYDQAIRKQVLKALVREARESGCAVVVGLAYPTALNRSVYSHCRFLPVPQLLQLERVAFSARAETKSDEPLLYHPGAWELTWGLHDLV